MGFFVGVIVGAFVAGGCVGELVNGDGGVDTVSLFSSLLPV